MNYEEFNDLISVEDKHTRFIRGFRFPSGEQFYIEPTFYTQLMIFKEIQPENFDKVINQLKKTAFERKKVIFVNDFENPFIELPGYKLLEFTDVSDPINVYFEDKSRGSDYGD